MTASAVQFQSLRIDRMPGIDDGGFALPGLCAGINLVHGPNGCGKSTTARAIQALLWPGDRETTPPRARLRGEYVLNGQTWSVELDAGHVVCRRAGSPADPPALGSADSRHRYHLPLHELVQARNESFAKRVLDASAGGFDLGAAAKALELRATPGQKRAQRNALDAARAAVRETRQRQEQVRAQADRLDDLRDQWEKAAAARRRVGLLRDAIAYRRAVTEHEQAAAAHGAFNPAIAKLTDHDAQLLNEYEPRTRDLAEQRRTCGDAMKAARQAIADARLPDDGLEADTIAMLRSACERVSELTMKVDQQAGELRKAEAEAAAARRRIGGAVDEDQLSALDAVEHEELSQFALEAEQLSGRRHAIDELLALLGEPDGDGGESSAADDLDHGLWCLHDWLAADRAAQEAEREATRRRESADRRRWLPTAACALVIVQGVIAALVHHWAWAIAAVVGAALAAVMLAGRGRRCDDEAPPADPRQTFREQFERCGLPAPAAWDRDTVSAHVHALFRQLGKAHVSRAYAGRRDAVQRERVGVEARRNEMEQRRRQLAERYGAQPAIDAPWLAVLADNVARWQRAADAAAALDVQVGTLTRQRDAELVKLNEKLAGFGFDASGDHREAARRIEDLNQRREHAGNARHDIRRAEDRLEQIDRESQELDRRYGELFHRAGVERDDAAAVHMMLEQREVFAQSRRRLDAAQTTLRDREAALRDDEALKERTAESLEDELESAEQLAAGADDLLTQINHIERDIETTQRAHDLEAALAQEQAALDALREARDADAAAMVGDLLVAHVRQFADRARPVVFARARELLSRVTHGRFVLEFEDADGAGGEPAFRGRDTATGQVRSLDELSTGERVQLLAAVRLAFVEQQEQGAALPLLLDETIGTSDDDRARAMIETVIEAARQGRQVFYFTAQPDEVGKWLDVLRGSDVPHAVIDLAQVRGLAQASHRPLRVADVPRQDVPPPEGMSHAEYGRLLDAPGFDPSCEQLGGTHLWHVIDDPAALHALLRRGVTQWGQVAALGEEAVAALTGDGNGSLRRAAAIVRALEAAGRAWRIGRGRAVDRQALVDSGAVSDVFLDRLAELAAQQEGDAKRLIAALEGGQIKGWRQAKTDELRQHLCDQGYLDERACIDREEMRVRVLRAVADELAENVIDDATVDRVLASLP